MLSSMVRACRAPLRRLVSTFYSPRALSPRVTCAISSGGGADNLPLYVFSSLSRDSACGPSSVARRGMSFRARWPVDFDLFASYLSVHIRCRKQDATTVGPVSTIFHTVLMTIAAARASKPVVGSSINIMEGLATSSTAIVNPFPCSADRLVASEIPTIAFFKSVSSTRFMTSSINI